MKKKKASPVAWAHIIGSNKHHFKKLKEEEYLCRAWVASAVMFLGIRDKFSLTALNRNHIYLLNLSSDYGVVKRRWCLNALAGWTFKQRGHCVLCHLNCLVRRLPGFQDQRLLRVSLLRSHLNTLLICLYQGNHFSHYQTHSHYLSV